MRAGERDDSAAQSAALRVRSVSKSYPGTVALAGVDLELRAGEVHALLGGNGSGKSTLVKVLAGVVEADPGGTLEVGGIEHPLSRLDAAQSHRLGLRFVHQDLALFPRLTVAENVALVSGFPRRGGRVSWRVLHREVAELLERFAIQARAEQQLGELRPAAQTMVAVARALQDETAEARRILFLDEATAALPEAERDHLLAAIRQVAGHGRGVLMVTHRLDEVLKVADQVTVLRDGKRVAGQPVEALDQDDLVFLVTGGMPETREPGPHHPVRTSDGATPRLELRSVADYGGTVRDVSISVQPREAIGLAGLEGAGASEAIRLAAGDLPLAAGELLVEGQPRSRWSVRAAVQAGMVYVPRDRAAQALFGGLGLKENLTAGDLRPYWRRLRLNGRSERAEAAEILDRYEVEAFGSSQPIATLSGGNQQKTVLARWLHRSPALLLLDEPTQGVDVGARRGIHNLIRRAVADGASVLVTSSDTDELAELCDRVLVLADGRVVGELAGERLNADAIDHLSYDLKDAA